MNKFILGDVPDTARTTPRTAHSHNAMIFHENVSTSRTSRTESLQTSWAVLLTVLYVIIIFPIIMSISVRDVRDVSNKYNISNKLYNLPCGVLCGPYPGHTGRSGHFPSVAQSFRDQRQVLPNSWDLRKNKHL